MQDCMVSKCDVFCKLTNSGAPQPLRFCQSRNYELGKGPHIDSLDHNTEAPEMSHLSLLTHLNGDSTPVRQLQVEGGHRSCDKEWDPVYERDTFIRS